MQKMISFFLFLFTTTTTAYAAQCPGTADILNTNGNISGYYWRLTDAAKTNWTLNLEARFTSANYTTFPETTQLTVATTNESNEVICNYALPDGTSIQAISNKKMNLNTINSTMFSKNSEVRERQSNNPFGIPGEEYILDIYTCNASAATASYCNWDWGN